MNNSLREIFIKELSNYDEDKPVLFPIESEILKNIIFNKEVSCDNGKNVEYYTFALEKDLLKKIDFKNISFDNVLVANMNFKGMTGIKINPQTVYKKDLRGGNFNGVEFIGPFDGTKISNTNFTGSRKARINPQTINMKTLRGTNLRNAVIIGPFDDVDIKNTKLKGCNIAYKNCKEETKKLVLVNNKNNTKR